MSKLEVNTIAPRTGTAVTLGESGDTINLGTGVSSGTGMGKILQVKQTIMSGNGVSTTSAFPIEVSGLSVSITPSSTSNKILATLDCCVGVDTDYWVFAGIRRDSTDLGRQRTSPKSGSGAPQDLVPLSITILDAPSSTSSLTYKAVFGGHTGGATATFNYRPDHSSSTTGYSALTVMEIAQ